MKFEKKNLDNQQVELVVETDVDLFNKSKGQAARAISREAKIAGFRPGKAPYDVVKRLYGEEFIEERAIDIMINDLYPEIVKEAEIKPYGPGKLDEVLEKNPPKFKITIPLEPSVELGDYKAIKKAYKLPETTEKDVEAVLKNLQLNYATPEDVERKAEKGDLVFCKINAVLNKPEKDEDAQILKDTPHQVLLGEETEEEENPFPFKGFGDNLIGLAKGESKEFSYKYPKDSNYQHLKGKEVNFSVEITSVKNLVKPELNDDFAKKLGLDDLATVKESIQHQLETEKKNEYENGYYDELLDKLVEKSTIKYPPLALEDEVNDVLKTFEQNLAKQNLDLDTYLKINSREKEDFIEKDIKPAARKRLEQSLVIDEISRAEKIELDQKELQQEYARSFMQIQSAPDFQKLQKQFTTRKLANVTVMQAASRLMNLKTLQRLKAYANGEEIPAPEQPDEGANGEEKSAKPAKAKKPAAKKEA